ncbi:hypothetical protein ASE75_06235 [Sphingomonas sp. Leaf17]|uniref:NYN domain-containing protein n=1 Tax=Sphingomonas sp. Leaf17 TaxID=1735683 RepID=UPI0006FEEBCD|nr:NYN domain-containing protein [Sphingomonas sp. Leaf17]KQM65824.1 hypothetical protein ASE75_06235 [Sphingomonas sp. Leaf17]
MIDIPTRNVALLIDADNASAATLDPVLTVLAELGTVNVRRVYGNWSKPALKSWRDMSIKHGIEPQQQFDLTKGKNATDMKMTIDAMDLLFRGRIDGFGIMSSDSDFMPLAMRIRQDGVPVYGFGTSRTPEGFRQACTRFIDVSALNDTSEPLPLPLPPAIGGDRAATPVAPPRPKPTQTIDAAVIKLLIDAYNAVKRDERGFASLTELGQLAGNRSSFDVRNYGFSRLSDLMQTVPNFQTERRENGRVYVKRLR